MSLLLLSPIPLDLRTFTINDLFLCMVTTTISLFLLFLMLILKTSSVTAWKIRKTVHLFGGTFIALLLFHFDTLAGVLLAIATFAIVFCILVFFSRFKLITDYFILNCRKREKSYSFLINTIATLLTLFILFLLFHNNPAVFIAGGLVISWADAAGEIIGKKIPSKKYVIFSEKSVSGSIAVFLFSCGSFLFSGLYFTISPSLDWIWKILVGGLICSLLEAFSWKWLDNLLLPPTACLVMLWIQF